MTQYVPILEYKLKVRKGCKPLAIWKELSAPGSIMDITKAAINLGAYAKYKTVASMNPDPQPVVVEVINATVADENSPRALAATVEIPRDGSPVFIDRIRELEKLIYAAILKYEGVAV